MRPVVLFREHAYADGVNRVPGTRSTVRPRTFSQTARTRVVAIVAALAVAAGLTIWLVTRGGTSSTQPSTTTTSGKPIGPVALTATELEKTVASLGQAVYWAGPESGHSYELQRIANGSVFVRYLPAGAKAGDKRVFRTIGTYPFPNAYAATRAIAHQSGGVALPVKGWIAVYRSSKPTSVYLASKGLPYQIEVYDPAAAEARSLAQSGDIAPVP
jgi:hypothetical protein